MTNKQYEHLGKAVVLASEIASEVDKLSDKRVKLEVLLTKMMSRDEALKVDNGIMTDLFPSSFLGNHIGSIVEKMKSKEGGV